MFKNVASKIALFVFDTTTGLPKTGDAANLTAYVSKDYGAVTVLADTSATEMDATNAKGWYLFDVAQAESNADSLVFTGKSSTANMSVVGKEIFTTPNRFSTIVVDAAGLVDANAVKVGPSGSGTAQTAGDIPARLPAALTANGNMKSSILEFITTAFSEGATGRMAAAIQQFFNIASPTSTMNVITTTTTATNLTTNNDKTGYGLSAAAVQAVWDALTSALTTVGSIGKMLVTNLTGDIYARLGAPAGASVSADIAAAKADTAAIKAKTDSLTFTVAGMADANVVDWKGATAPAMTGDAFARLGAPAGASVSADVAAVKADTVSILSKLLKYVQLILRKDSAIATDNATEVTAINANGGSGGGAFANTTDAQEAIRDNMGTAQTGDAYAVVNDSTFGNSKLVRSTTPANTLDVSATGEAGLDFNNIKDATGAHTLTNITVPLVTTTTTATNLTTNNDKTGYALSAAGIVAIWAYVVEGTHTAVGYMRLMAAALVGKLSGAATNTIVIRDVDDTKNRISVTVDADGNRSAFGTRDET